MSSQAFPYTVGVPAPSRERLHKQARNLAEAATNAAPAEDTSDAAQTQPSVDEAVADMCERHTLNELKAMCRDRGLKQKGTKALLARQLLSPESA